MRIEIVVDPSRAGSGPSLASRVAPPPAAAQANGTAKATRSVAKRLERTNSFLTYSNTKEVDSAEDVVVDLARTTVLRRPLPISTPKWRITHPLLLPQQLRPRYTQNQML
jgi:hypothetical protein